MRNKLWLDKRLEIIWGNHFSDVERKNKINIAFRGRSKSRFGFIKDIKGITLIGINFLFSNEKIPEWVIDVTIAHELVHYMHGFFSPYEKLYRYPHQGGIVRKELKKRGFEEHLRKERKWFKESWLKNFEDIKKQSYEYV